MESNTDKKTAQCVKCKGVGTVMLGKTWNYCTCEKGVSLRGTQFQQATAPQTGVEVQAEKYAHDKVFPVKDAQYAWSLLTQMKAEKEVIKTSFIDGYNANTSPGVDVGKVVEVIKSYKNGVLCNQSIDAMIEEIEALPVKSGEVVNSIGAKLITEERIKQIIKYGYTAEHDYSNNAKGDCALAACVLISTTDENSYLQDDLELRPTGWDGDIFKSMMIKPYEQRLIIAGALIAAEIDRENN